MGNHYMMTTHSQSAKAEVYNDLKDTLCQTAQNRKNRQTFVQTPKEVLEVTGSKTEIQWHLDELKAMTEKVNEHRTALGKKNLSIAEVARVEMCARGHVDYSNKFSLYCAELVTDKE